ncbi:MAG: hypothetical protein WCT35_04850 [Sideroxydans sp.]|jgi:hypothetical protein
MSQDEDFLRQVLKLVMAAAPSFSEEQALQVEQQVRRDWGGERPFIAKRGPLLKDARVRVIAQVGTKPDSDIIRENGISRRTMYNWIKKGKDNG